MACYFPLEAWRSDDGSIHFDSRYRHRDRSLKLPCGRCVGCRLERSRQWAIRCVHEAQMHDDNCFVTLTYAPEHLPSPPSLCLPDFQKFMKRLRKAIGKRVRFFHCGEYGEKVGRPHYHACLFGWRPDDLKLYSQRDSVRLYSSDFLANVWGKGFVTVGDVTFDSAAYVARYIMKKVNGDDAQDHYTRVDPLTGEVYQAVPEYVTMSRRPGIASGWYEKFSSDVFPSDSVVVRGREIRPPRFYLERLKSDDSFLYDDIKSKRDDVAKLHVDNNTERRLLDRHEVQQARLRKLPRNLE